MADDWDVVDRPRGPVYRFYFRCAHRKQQALDGLTVRGDPAWGRYADLR
jgi:hypothetical protein